MTSTAATSWLDLPSGSGIRLDNLPYGSSSTPSSGRRTGVAIGDLVLDLPATTGERKAPTDDAPTFGPSQHLDIEAEVGFIVGAPSELGRPVPLSAFPEHVFGVCLVDDWSTRDLQAWEYVPLGPFLGKSFLTSVSPWVVLLAALEAARVTPPAREPQPLPYLDDSNAAWGLRPHPRGAPQRRAAQPPALRLPVLDRRSAAGAHDRQRREPPHRRSVRLQRRLRAPEGPARLVDRAVVGRHGAADPLRRHHSHLPRDGDVVLITATAPGAGGSRISLGEVTGRVQPARAH